MKIGASDDKNDNEKEVACPDDVTTADMKIGAGDNRRNMDMFDFSIKQKSQNTQ